MFYSSFDSNLETFNDLGTYYEVIVSACFVNITKDEDDLTALMNRLIGTHGVEWPSGFGLAVEIGGKSLTSVIGHKDVLLATANLLSSFLSFCVI